jgi:potassium-transporting ATPase KdpC subunit
MPIRIPRDDVPASTGGILRPALTLFVVLSLITGLLYPLAVTGVAQTVFPHQANGSLVTQGGKAVGSELIGQSFTEPGHFWGRPSATAPMPYNAAASGGSNLGPTNPALAGAVKARIEALRAADPGNTQPVPVDLVTASASGLDPHISPAAAAFQAERVARARGMPVAQVQALVRQHTQSAWLGLLGEPRVNVLVLNLALDSLPKP